MAKYNSRDDRYDDDQYNDSVYHEKLREHRKTKRMKNALRSKDWDSLIEMDDD